MFFAVPMLVVFASAQDEVQAHISPSSPTMVDSSLEASSMHFDVNLVLVPVTVIDEKNRPVLGLESKNFDIFEEKQKRQIRYFFSEDAPVSIGLVLDFSGSMKDKMDILREAVREFFVNAHPDDDYYVVAVSKRPVLLANGTRSIHNIETKLSQETAGGWTALYDSVELTLRMMRHSHYRRKAVVIVSDGGDNVSRTSLKKVVKIAEESNADVYAIGIFDAPLLFLKPLDTALGKRGLTRMTDATGGRTIIVENAAQLPKVIGDLSLELRSQYVLGFRPRNLKRDGKWRKVKVRVNPPEQTQRLEVNYKKGYFGPTN